MSSLFNIRALKSFVSAGFKSTTHALCEIVDNAFDAQAKKVRVIFLEKPRNSSSIITEIIIVDDGNGMDQKTIAQALQIGGGTNLDEQKLVNEQKIGKFGFGLPVSSLSQCDRVTLYSWQNKDEFLTTHLDLNEQMNSGSTDIQPVEELSKLPADYNGLNLGETATGTIVSWQQCERLDYAKAQTIVNHAQMLLGRIFRHLISDGKQILLEICDFQDGQNIYRSRKKEKMICNDPLFLTEECQLAAVLVKAANKNAEYSSHLSEFSINEKKCKPTNQKLLEHSFPFSFEFRNKTLEFEIVTSYAFKDIQHPGIKQGGKTEVGQFYGKKNNEGGITFVRSGREIHSDNFGHYLKTNEKERWWTIEIRFSPDADELMGVANNKQSVVYKYDGKNIELSDDVYDKFSSTAVEARRELFRLIARYIDNARKAASKKINQDTKLFLAESNTAEAGGISGIPANTHGTRDAIGTVEGKGKQLNEEQKARMHELLTDKYDKVPPDEIARAIEQFSNWKTRAILLYAPSPGQHLWEATPIRDFKVAFINTNHEYYTKLIEPFREAGCADPRFQTALTGLELFITSLVWEELEGFQNTDSRMNAIEDYRTSVGIKLKRYMRDNDIKVELEELISSKNSGLSDSD
jgi:hypothetical protein